MAAHSGQPLAPPARPASPPALAATCSYLRCCCAAPACSRFNVHRTYSIGTPMPPLDNATFAAVQEVRAACTPFKHSCRGGRPASVTRGSLVRLTLASC